MDDGSDDGPESAAAAAGREARSPSGQPLGASWYGELQMRTALEQYVCSEEFAKLHGRLSTPMCNLVAGGGIGTLRQCRHSLSERRPVLCFGDAGGACEMLRAYWDVVADRHSNLPPKPSDGSEHRV